MEWHELPKYNGIQVSQLIYLQTNRVKFRNGAVTDLCLLCSAASEDRVHFIAECNELSSVRQNYISQIESILSVNNPIATVNAVINNRDLLTQLILDCTWIVPRLP